ncbi:tubulin glycylase 3B-like [Teleopsis dalmanni]|uniref:tubulin glycylase 3B-like n=1 Tax=Teleopsis dalmanni TaxID=139649 RepID=UPI0018CE4C58|nr:tubulin glycylase 3B-like [Teleopsis dalmanni]
MDGSKFQTKIKDSSGSSGNNFAKKAFTGVFPLQKYSMLDMSEIKYDLNGDNCKNAYPSQSSINSKNSETALPSTKNLRKRSKSLKKKPLQRKQGNTVDSSQRRSKSSEVPPRRTTYAPLPRVATLQHTNPKKHIVSSGAITKTTVKPIKSHNASLKYVPNIRPLKNPLIAEMFPEKVSPKNVPKSTGGMRKLPRNEDKARKFPKNVHLIQITDLSDKRVDTIKSIKKSLKTVQPSQTPVAKKLKSLQKTKKPLEQSQKYLKEMRSSKNAEESTVKVNKLRITAGQSQRNENNIHSPSMKSINLEERQIIRVETKPKDLKKIEPVPSKSEKSVVAVKIQKKSRGKRKLVRKTSTRVSIKNALPLLLPLGKLRYEESNDDELVGEEDRTSLPYTIAKSKEFADDTKVRILFGHYYTQVLRAFNKRKIFTIYGEYFTLRKALLDRGWLEKLLPTRLPHLQALPDDKLILSARPGNVEETVVMSKIINSFPAFFVWQPKEVKDVYAEVLPIRNRIRRSKELDFTTKLGLIGCARNQFSSRKSGMSYPRFYRLDGDTADRSGFIKDYRQTQCRCLIYYLWNCLDSIESYVDAENGIVSPNILKFALNSIENQLHAFRQNDDDYDTGEETSYEDWNDFITMSIKIMDQKAKLKMTIQELTRTLRKGTIILDKILKWHPDYNWDGDLNVWLLKPGNKSRGIGIVVKKNLDEILDYAVKNVDRNYVVQKYVERPLLIYKTKFDVRAYMLQTIADDTLSIWIYKDCYLRFCSQEYSLTSLRASIHLTNNSVQRLYKNSRNRDQRLPMKNMWSLKEFKNYVKYECADSLFWENTIFVGFAQNLIAVVMASFQSTKLIANSFELYGCDFMLDSAMHPILIEINSTPDMTSSTAVTAEICPKVLADVIKVVVDHPSNPLINTGGFDLVFKAPCKTEKKARKIESIKLLEPTQVPFNIDSSFNSNFSFDEPQSFMKLP